jgi:hypothetical protein
VLVLVVRKQFQHKTLEQEPCHLQAVDGQVALWVGPGNQTGLDVGGPLDTPDNWLNALAAADPNATGSTLADVAETDAGGQVRCQLLHVSQPATSALRKEDSDVLEGG